MAINMAFFFVSQVAKMLQQISSGQEFDTNDIFLAPLNDFVKKASREFANWFMECKDIVETIFFLLFYFQCFANFYT